jgi:hypothetical protein
MFATWWIEKGGTQNVEHEFLHLKYLFRGIGLFFLAEMESSRLAGWTTTPHVMSIKSLAFFQFVTNRESR